MLRLLPGAVLAVAPVVAFASYAIGITASV